MPIKYPCIECKKPVRCNQLGILCDICKLWIHFKCTNLTKARYDFLATNINLPYNCHKCSPLPHIADEILPTSSNNVEAPNANNIPSHNDSFCSADTEFSDAHSFDSSFESIDENESGLRGLNFASLPCQPRSNPDAMASSISKTTTQRIIPRSVNYKYPCNICRGACKENVHDSIQCTWCDEWVHQKCTNLTYDQFMKHCSPENINLPYYCDICEFGSRRSKKNQKCLSASSISSFDSDDIVQLCPNSVFNDKDDIPTSEYYTTEEFNIEIQKTPDNIRLIHINAVSLCKHIDDITAMIAELTKLPSIIFISETRVQDEKEEFRKSQIKIAGYTFVIDNSPTCAGGTAIYVSDDLIYEERDDIIFNRKIQKLLWH